MASSKEDQILQKVKGSDPQVTGKLFFCKKAWAFDHLKDGETGWRDTDFVGALFVLTKEGPAGRQYELAIANAFQGTKCFELAVGGGAVASTQLLSSTAGSCCRIKMGDGKEWSIYIKEPAECEGLKQTLDAIASGGALPPQTPTPTTPSAGAAPQPRNENVCGLLDLLNNPNPGTAQPSRGGDTHSYGVTMGSQQSQQSADLLEIINPGSAGAQAASGQTTPPRTLPAEMGGSGGSSLAGSGRVSTPKGFPIPSKVLGRQAAEKNRPSNDKAVLQMQIVKALLAHEFSIEDLQAVQGKLNRLVHPLP